MHMYSGTISENKLSEAIKRWLDALYDNVRTVGFDDNKRIILIAISRKMPRIFEWIKTKWLPSLTETDGKRTYLEKFEALDRCNLVSEHAIPFLWADCSDTSKNTPIFVVDDIIISGQTMSRVSSDIYAYTKKEPFISTIFKYRDASIECTGGFIESSEGKKGYTELTESEEVKDWSKYLCQIIKSSSLPMELEFPAFHIENKTYEELRSYMENASANAKLTPYSLGEEKKNFTLILENELRWIYNHDYPRLRLFEKDKGATLESSAPRVVSMGDIKNPGLFTTAPYNEIWKTLTDSISPKEADSGDDDLSFENTMRIEHRKLLSLVVWANYLYSFSVVMNCCRATAILKEFPGHPQVKTEDVALLCGPYLAEGITEKLNSIAEMRVVEPRGTEVYHDTKMYISIDDEKYEKEYTSLRASVGLNSNSIEEAIIDLFQKQYDMKKKALSDEDCMSDRFDFGETIQSLQELFDFRFKDPESEDKYIADLNKAIDQGIDEGRLSPLYYELIDSTGVTCWRRFYRGGSSSLL